MLALAWMADDYAAHGWTASWYASPDGRARLVAETTEQRIHFPNDHRPLARYIQNWPFEQLPIPAHPPHIEAVLQGQLRIPGKHPYAVRVRSPNSAELWIDGNQQARSRVTPGLHDVRIRWTARPRRKHSEHVRLHLQWAPLGEGYRDVPHDAVSPRTGGWTWMRILLWVTASALGLGLAFGLYLVSRSSSPSVRRHRLWRIAAVAIVLLGLGYRLWDYSVMPDYRENGDELFATWNGWQLLTDGTTRGWSLWPHYYGNRVEHQPFQYFQRKTWHIIQPYLEHPPLLHVLVGAAAKIGGAGKWAHARLKHTRLVPIGLSGLSLVLILAIGRRLDPRPHASLLSALLYATVPVIVLQTRVIKEEALLVPLSLGGLWFYMRWRDDDREDRWLILASTCIGLCALAKVTGGVLVVAFVAIVLRQAGWRPAIVAAGTAPIGLILLLLYGTFIDWDLFWYTTMKQASGRPVHWNLFPRFFDDALINHNLIGHGHLLFLWLAYVGYVVARRERPNPLLTLFPVLYIIGMAVSAGNWMFGWYLVPIYPFLCLGAGGFLADLWDEPDMFRGILLVGLAVMYGLNFTIDPEWARESGNWPTMRFWVRLFVVSFVTPYGLVEAFPGTATRRLSQLATAAALTLFVVLSGHFVFHYDVFYERYHHFDRIEFFDR